MKGRVKILDDILRLGAASRMESSLKKGTFERSRFMVFYTGGQELLQFRKAPEAILFFHESSNFEGGRLYTQCHNRVDDIVVILFEGLDSLLP